MKKVSLLIFVSLILLLTFASCTLLGNDPSASCVHEWKEATCDAPKTCASCNATEGEALGHDWTEATCSAPKTCKTCEATEGEKLAHDWNEATCTTPKTCKVCNETVGSVKAHLNDVVLEAVEPTCTSTGLTAGVKCSACGTVTTEQTVVEKKAHTPEVVPGKEATCTETGLTNGEKCSVCDTTLVEQEVIGLKAHTEENVPGKEATCTETGLTDGKKCSVCGTTTVLQTEIPATGHVNTTKYPAKAPTCTEPGYKAYEQCACGHYVVEKVPVDALGHDPADPVEENYEDPTCTVDGGYDMVTYCYECGEVIKTEHTSIPATGHKFENYVYDEGSAKCGIDGTQTAYCSNNCGEHDTKTAPGTALTHKMPEDAACGETWNCVHCGEGIEVRQHTYDEATCIHLATCTHCGATTGEYAAHTPAEAVREDVVDSDCLTAGSYNAVVYCAVEGCGHKISSTPTEIPAKGHDMVGATCTADDHCSRCDYVAAGTMKTSHTLTSTLGADNKLTYKCATCDAEFAITHTQYYTDGSSLSSGFTFNDGKTNASYAGDTNAPMQKVDADGNQYYEFLRDEEYNKDRPDIGSGVKATGQATMWIPAYHSSSNHPIKGLNAANGSIALLSFDMNYAMDQQITFNIVYGAPSTGETWYQSPLGKIMDAVFYIQTVGGTKAELRGWNGVVLATYEFEADSTFTAFGATGWFNVQIGIELDDATDMMIAHYYINGQYVTTQAHENTLQDNTIGAVQLDGTSKAVNSGYAFDNFAFGFTNGSTWTFDDCDHTETAVVTDPTCTTEGYTTYTCSKCHLAQKRDFVPALGHATVEVAGQASTCLVQGWDAYSYCSRCETPETGKVLLPLSGCVGAAPVQEHVVNAECGVAGSYEEVVYCSVCGEELSRETKEIPALEHDSDTVVPGFAATCTAAGLTDGAKCSKCGKEMTAQVEIPATGHTIVVDPAVEATCKEDGKTAGEHCSVCDYVLEGTVVSKDTVPHTYDNDEDADCNVCGATRDVACKHTNKEEIPAVDATCTTAGSTAGEKCADCGEITTAPTTVPATGHTEVADAAVEATCTTAGKTAGKHCSVCSEVLVAQTEIAAKGHTETTDHAVDPTCTATGLTEGKHCTVCGTATVPQEEVPAKGHNMAAATCDVPSTCTVCGHTEGAPVANHTPKASVVDGKLTYKCATCAQSFTADQQLVYTGNSASDFLFSKNGDPTLTIVDGAYKITAGTQKSQYMIYGPSNDINHKDVLTGWNSANESFGVYSFRIQPGTITDAMRVIVMSARNNPNWDANKLPGSSDGWSGNSMDVLQIAPNGDGTFNVKTNNIASNVIATVNGNDWTEIQMFIQIDSYGVLTISYYVNGQFCTSYTRDLHDPELTQTIKNLSINNFYMCGWTEAGTSLALDDIYFGYQKNCEWLFDSHDHVYGEPETVAPTCGEQGYDKYVCSCGHIKRENFVAATGHNAPAATCTAASVCTKCGETVAPATGHSLNHTYANSKLTYGCANCDMTFAIESEGVYYDGTPGSVPPKTYTGGASKYNGGKNVLVSNGEYFEAISDIDATVNTESQLQVWIPYTKDQTASGQNFNELTLANASTGVLSFKLNVNFEHVSDILTSKLAHNAWGAAGCIDIDIFKINPKFENGVRTGYNIYGWSNKPGDTSTALLTTVAAGEGGWTGWMDVKIVFVVNTEKDTFTAHYYFNDEYLGSGEKNLTVTDDRISAVYFNLNSWMKGTGYYMDDLAFGHTVDSHWTLDGQEHNVTPATCASYATCSCGWTGSVSVAEHNVGLPTYDSVSHSVVYSCSNDGCDLTCEMNGYYYDGNKQIANFMQNGNGFYGSSKDDTVSGNGYAQYILGNVADGLHVADRGDQYMHWVPDASHPKHMEGFSCANNATGVLAFKINSYTTEVLQWKVNSERGCNVNNGDEYTWSWDYSYSIFTIGAVTSEGQQTVQIKGLRDAALGTLELSKDENGNFTKWTGWLDVYMVISLTDDGKISVTYYINGQNYGTQTADMYATKRITSAYCNGYTKAEGSGYYLDDLVFAYTDHYTLDGKKHEVTPATCTTPATCSCGYVSEGTAPHSYAASNYNAETNTFDYGCKYGCGISLPMTGYSSNEKLTLVNAEDASGNANGYIQHQKWLPSGNEANLTMYDGFRAENNSYGVLLLRVKAGCDNGGFKVTIANARNNNEGGNGSEWLGWGKSDIDILFIGAPKAGVTEVNVQGGFDNSTLLTTVPVTDGWTDWLNIRIEMQFEGTVLTLYYYINDTFMGEFSKDIVNATTGHIIHNGHIQATYLNGTAIAAGQGWMLENYAFGYTNLYNKDGSLKVTEIGTRNANEDNTSNVTDAALRTIVDGKLKQLDQSNAATASDAVGYFVKEGGTSRYVSIMGKDGETVQGVYVSRSVDWDTYASVSTQNAFRSEFRFELDDSKAIKSISFDYIVNGSVSPNRSKDANDKNDMAIFQVKSGSTYTNIFTDKGGEQEDGFTLYEMDGQWHSFTYEWKEGDPTNLSLFLIILSEFQGEMVMSNIVVEYQA